MVDAWLAEAPETWLHRGTAKKVIMTVPYGARENSQAEQVAEAIAGRVDQVVSCGHHKMQTNGWPPTRSTARCGSHILLLRPGSTTKSKAAAERVAGATGSRWAKRS